MLIEVDCEKNNAFVNVPIRPTENFPIHFIFMDRTTGIVVQANLNMDSLKYFLKTFKEYNLDKIEEIENSKQSYKE